VKQWLKELGFRYFAWEYDANRYCDEIITLQNELIRNFPAILAADSIPVGVCQKSISLYLKYLWLFGDSGKKPIFPPLDRGVLQATNAPGPKSFSQIKTIQDYRTICDHIEQYAKSNGFGGGACWEAEYWKDEQDDDA
jgi:hypothetical protein